MTTTVSFQGGRTIGCAVPPVVAWSWLSTMGRSLGACSVSSNSQSKPALANTSTVRWLDRLLHSPICLCPALMARLNVFTGMSIGLLRLQWISGSGTRVARVPEAAQPARLRGHAAETAPCLAARAGRSRILVAPQPGPSQAGAGVSKVDLRARRTAHLRRLLSPGAVSACARVAIAATGPTRRGRHEGATWHGDLDMARKALAPAFSCASCRSTAAGGFSSPAGARTGTGERSEAGAVAARCCPTEASA